MDNTLFMWILLAYLAVRIVWDMRKKAKREGFRWKI